MNMKSFLTIVFLLCCLGLFVAYADQEVFPVQRVMGNAFMINGHQFTAREGTCPVTQIKAGHGVRFTEGGPNGVCLSAVFIDLKSGVECSVWCH
jgi:hypothetical protein